jgi:putative transferase (TIGR04331 family)
MYIHTTNLFYDFDDSKKKCAISKFFFTHEQIFQNNKIEFIFENDKDYNKPDYDVEKYIHRLYRRYIRILTKSINELGLYSYTDRTFELMAGHWLKRYLSTSYHKYRSVKKILHMYSDVKFFDYYEQSKIEINNGSEFVFYSNSSMWNHLQYLSIIKYLKPNVQIEKIKNPPVLTNTIQKYAKKSNKFEKILNNFLNKFRKRIYIKNSYLNYKTLIYISLKKLSIPSKNNLEELSFFELDLELRKKIKLVSSYEDDEFTSYIDSIIMREIPTCYIEGIKSMIEYSKSIYPKQVEMIFTSNSFDTDELFKSWVCMQISSGSKYIVGQHGAGYGTSKFFKTYWDPEIATCDKFISWGWTTQDIKKVCPHFNFKISTNKLKRLIDEKLSILIIFPSLNNLILHWDDTQNHLCLVDSLIKFVSSIDHSYSNKTIIRLHHENTIYNFKDYDYLSSKLNNKNIQINNGNTLLYDLISITNLTIFFYDSTGFLEHLAQDSKCILYLQDGLDSINEDARIYYQNLVDANILHLSINSLIAFITIQKNYDNWWSSFNVIQAKKNYLFKFSKSKSDNYNLSREFGTSSW